MKVDLVKIVDGVLQHYRDTPRFTHMMTAEVRTTALGMVREVVRQLTETPTEPARVDVKSSRPLDPALHVAWQAVSRWGITTDPLVTKKSLRVLEHVDPDARDAGLCRVAFFGPKYVEPSPVKEHVIVIQQGRAGFLAMEKEGQDKEKMLREKYGPDFHVETVNEYLFPPSVKVRVWRGEDWLRIQTAPFRPAEVARFFAVNLKTLKIITPYAAKHAARVSQLAQARRKHGKSARAFRDYIREQNKKLAPMVKSGEMLAKERNAELVKKALAFNQDLHSLTPSALESRIQRALGFKQ